MYKVIMYLNDYDTKKFFYNEPVKVIKNVSLVLVHDNKLLLCAGTSQTNLSFDMDNIKKFEVVEYDNSI